MYRIRDLREDRDLSQTQIAEVIQTTQQQYSKIENGKADISGEKLILLAEYYNVSADYILGLVKEPRPLKKRKNDEPPLIRAAVCTSFMKILSANGTALRTRSSKGCNCYAYSIYPKCEPISALRIHHHFAGLQQLVGHNRGGRNLIAGDLVRVLAAVLAVDHIGNV